MTGPHGLRPPLVFASDRPLVFGHRGGARLGPENTLAAFARAMAAGADGFECDVRFSADHVPVVIHDPTLERTTDATGAVRRRSAAELGRVDAGCRFAPSDPAFAVTGREGVPTLEEALTRFPGARVIVEVKDESPRLAEAVAALVHGVGAEARVCIGSFHQVVLDRVRAVAPDLTTSASRREAFWTLARSWVHWPFPAAPLYRAFQVPERSGRLRVAGPAFVRRAHRERASVQVWTVDAPEDVRRLLAMGVDGIISDRPDLVVGARDAFRVPAPGVSSR